MYNNFEWYWRKLTSLKTKMTDWYQNDKIQVDKMWHLFSHKELQCTDRGSNQALGSQSYMDNNYAAET